MDLSLTLPVRPSGEVQAGQEVNVSPTQEALALAYEEGVRNGSEITARELAAEIEGLREDLRIRDEKIVQLLQRLDELIERYED